MSGSESRTQSPASGGVSQKRAELTQREHEVLHLVLEEMTSRQIADRLGLSPRTVEHHRARIRAKISRQHQIPSLYELARDMTLTGPEKT